MGTISIMEVVMCPPEMFVRPLAYEEALTLKLRTKQAKHFSTQQLPVKHSEKGH